MSQLTILNVGYPLAPVSSAGGGAEQVLGHLDAGLVARGHRSLVIAPEGSHVTGRLIAVPRPPDVVSHRAYVDSEVRHRAVIARVLATERVDVVHLHGVDFYTYLPADPAVPTIVTLHLPRAWYQPDARDLGFPDVRFVCVSRAQARSWPGRHLDIIENGIPIDSFGAAVRRRRFVLLLGRVCPEKGWHLALDAARAAGVPAVLCGVVHGFPEHQRYYEAHIVPRLQPGLAVHIGSAGSARKRRLLAAASCVVVSSQAPETSSLVAIEALASGTPVVAFPRGALTDVVDHGRTGFLVETVEEMAEAIQHVRALDPAACRAASVRYDVNHMVDAYLALYARVSADRSAASVA
jgi:glycosyltransferase involved in cell wall biosynthesis